MPPNIYDPATDEFREATQEDVDQLCTLQQAYGTMLDVLRQKAPDLAPPHLKGADAHWAYWRNKREEMRSAA